MDISAVLFEIKIQDFQGFAIFVLFALLCKILISLITYTESTLGDAS
jgi:hypothetical protein